MNKEVYFEYDDHCILKGRILQKVFRIMPKGITDEYYGHINCDDDFLRKMFYRYYYVISVDSVCELVSVNGGVEKIKDKINHSINFVIPIEKAYCDLDSLMLNEQKVEYVPINGKWLREEVSKYNAPSNGFVLDSYLNITSVHIVSQYIEFEPIHINLSRPLIAEDEKDEVYYSSDKYKVETTYMQADGGNERYSYSDLFLTIRDAVEAKKKHFEVTDVLRFTDGVYDDWNNIDFEEIKEEIIKRLEK